MGVRVLPLLLLFPLLLLPPLHASAEGEVLTRREGFLMLWQSILRPAEEVSQSDWFADVQPGDLGFLEISYAKNRKILRSGTRFFPDESLEKSDVLVWLLRTRNIAYPEEITKRSLRRYLRKYPLTDHSRDLNVPLSSEELTALMRSLDTMLYEEVHKVSLYAEDFHGQGTAFGETFDMHALTAAHRTLPYNTFVEVRNVENGKTVTVRINDRGPYVHGRDMDLSLAAFETISPRSRGVIRATFHRLGDISLVSGCATERRYQKRITRDVRFHQGVPHTFSLGGILTLVANRPFVVRGVTYPDGVSHRLQDFVLPKEKFSFKPAIVGEYRFIIGTKEGRRREMKMKVVECMASEK